jgi:hypothetical protein
MNIKHINNYDDFLECEELRHRIFNLGDVESPYYIKQFLNFKLFVVGAFIDDELIGCIYFAPFNSDYGSIDYVVVEEKYQRSKLHVGTSLLKYIEDHKEDICEYTSIISISKYFISPISKDTEKLYKKQGYKKTKLDGTLCKNIG